MDQRLLLLPDRNSDAQLVAASDPACGSRMEKATVRPAPGARSTMKKSRSCENARPGRQNFWRLSCELDAPIRASQLLRQTSLDNQTLRALVKRGLVELREEAVVRDPHADEQFIATSNLILNQEQTHALEEITQALDSPEKSRPILLHGVTGCGKTEIYLQAIRAALDRGSNGNRSRPGNLAHAANGRAFQRPVRRCARTRSRCCTAIYPKASVTMNGTKSIPAARASSSARAARSSHRSKNLGLIVVDEEHETTYKQEEAPRYHARDVAIVRAKIEKCVVVLGKRHAVTRELSQCRASENIGCLHLTQRIDEKPDAAYAHRRSAPGAAESRSRLTILSEKLRTAIAARLEKREQTILFLNRRGFSTSLLCSDCGEARNCPELQRRAHLPSAPRSRG